METIVNKEGYMYIYLSNEHDKLVDVFFPARLQYNSLSSLKITAGGDDFTIVHKKSPIVQTEDYYPFGLSFNQLTREETQEQNYKFNGIERQSDLDLNVDMAFYRVLDPAIGRWWQVDPKSEIYYSWSPFNAMGNNPVNIMDPLGDRWLKKSDEKRAESQQKALSKRIKKLTKKIEKTQKKLQKALTKNKTDKASSLGDKIETLAKFAQENAMSHDDLEYAGDENTVYFTYENAEGDVGGTFRDFRTVNGKNKPVIVLGVLSSFGNEVHELGHGVDIATGNIGTRGMKMIADERFEKSEISAYKAQLAATGSLPPSDSTPTPKRLSEVTGRYVGGIKNGKGEYVYPSIRKKYNKNK